MRQDIRLFLGDRELEFSKVPQILFNYTETDLHNPTTVKNSWTKTIQVEGTPRNNDIFGHFWKLDRYQEYGNGQTSTQFNPLVKTDFSLYVGGSLYERGYAKLTNVEYSNGVYTYSLNLFGGVGQFLTCLTYQDDSDVKLTLADLNYNFVESGIENVISGWTINKDEVYNAWGTVCNYAGTTASSRYNLIQYVPAYEGYPENFDAKRVMINNHTQFRYFQTSGVSQGVGYTPILNGVQDEYGWSIGESPNDLTEWETLDLRSYLQRPAVRMKYIIDACGDPSINGGYQLDLDSHFFNQNNPYYWNSYVTLDSIQNMLSTESGMVSNTTLTKQIVLSGDKSPADYLVSFAKLFGLYFYYDPSESASNTSTYPRGVIHLMDRNTFFTEEVVDINNLIDYSKKSTITPTVAASKWLSFNTEQIDSEVGNAYKDKYGYDYGRQSVNTNYSFDNKTTNLYDGSVFKGGIMVREFSSKYKIYIYESDYHLRDYDNIPSYALNTNNFQIKLFSSEYDEYDAQNWVNGYYAYSTQYLNPYGLRYGDSFPKIQLHSDDNKSSDGSGVLLFLNGSYTTNGDNGVFNYYITDDVSDMVELNDNTPCWILTFDEYDHSGARIARKINAVPNFTRDWIKGPQQEGSITLSWNFGHPQETFVQNVYSTSGDSIYDKTWGDYIRDMYDVNTKMYTAYVKFSNVDVSMLRKYYWFRNCLWRLNKVKDYDCNSFETTQCEFIKVQNVDNYKLAQITAGGGYRLTLDSYSIGSNGGTITGTVVLQDGGSWSRGSTVHIEYANGTTTDKSSSSWISPATGSGQSSRLTVTVPANTSAYTRNITITINYGDNPPMTATITQAAPQASPYLAFNSSPININADGGSISAGFTKQNVRTGLTATSNVAWIYDIAVNESTNTVTASVSANTGYQRSGKITLNGTGINGTAVSAEVQIDQTSGGPAELSVQPDAINFDYLSTSGDTIYVSYGGSWTITEQDQ